MLNQEKIGKFIAERRKNQGMTQKQLAEKMNVSDKAVSKWETGRSMPDNSILFDLCSILDINVNELLSGEKLSDDNYHGKAEENMMTLMKEKQKNEQLNGKVGLALGIIFVIGIAWMSAGSIVWFLDTPSLLLLIGFMVLLLYMSGLIKDFGKGIAFFFFKKQTLKQEEVMRVKAAMKLVLTALPIVGIVIFLISMIGIIGNLKDVSMIGPNLAVAILTLLYSFVFEMLLLPVAAKIWSKEG